MEEYWCVGRGGIECMELRGRHGPVKNKSEMITYIFLAESNN